MFKPVLLIAAAAAMVSVILGVGSLRGDPGPTLTGTPKALNQIPIGQAYHAFFPYIQKTNPISVKLPPTLGFALTEVVVRGGLASLTLSFKVNGVIVRYTYPQFFRSYGPTTAEYRSSPPIVVPPGATLEIIPSEKQWNMSISGYFLTLADLGITP